MEGGLDIVGHFLPRRPAKKRRIEATAANCQRGLSTMAGWRIGTDGVRYASLYSHGDMPIFVPLDLEETRL